MPEEDGKTFGDAYRLYEKWRSVEVSSLDEWMQITKELHDFIVEHQESPLSTRLVIGIMDTFDDLYKNGMKPSFVDYIGRSDL